MATFENAVLQSHPPPPRNVSSEAPFPALRQPRLPQSHQISEARLDLGWETTKECRASDAEASNGDEKLTSGIYGEKFPAARGPNLDHDSEERRAKAPPPTHTHTNVQTQNSPGNCSVPHWGKCHGWVRPMGQTVSHQDYFRSGKQLDGERLSPFSVVPTQI